MQIQKKCRVARPKLAGVVQPGDAAHAQLSSRKVTGGTATPTPVRPPPQEPHLELSEPVCSWDIKSGLMEEQLQSVQVYEDGGRDVWRQRDPVVSLVRGL